MPLAKAGRTDLDFGQGFYSTEILDQAKLWADRMSRQRHAQTMVNIYDFDKGNAQQQYRYLQFDKYDILWLDFIAGCRTGSPLWEQYDCIEGGIANDRVIDTVEAYIAGIMDAEHALTELSKHSPNNQICFINQELIDNCLRYKETIIC